MKKEKRNVLIVADYFYPHWTGFAKSIYSMVKSISSDFNITVLTVRHDKSLPEREKLFSAQIIRENYIFSLSRSKYSLSIIKKFLELVRENDIIFLNSPSSNILIFSLIAKFFKKKVLIFHHGDLMLPESLLNLIIEKIFFISSILAFSISDKIATHTLDYAKNSKLLEKFLYKLSPFITPIYVNQNNGDSGSFKQLKAKNKIFFGFAGRFVEEKGFDILFDAIPLIIQKLPDAHFLFAGDMYTSYENFLQKNSLKFNEVKKHITELGLLGERDLISFYRLIKFIIIPSRLDSFNLVQAESMLTGTPVIISDIPGARVLVKETGFGITFKKENYHDLAEKVIKAWRERDKILENRNKVPIFLDNMKNTEKIKKFIEE